MDKNKIITYENSDKSTQEKIKFLFKGIDKKIYKNLKLTVVGLYSITPLFISIEIAKLLYDKIKLIMYEKRISYENKLIVIDGCSGFGGDTYGLLQYFDVIANELNEFHFKLLKYNIHLLTKHMNNINIEFINQDITKLKLHKYFDNKYGLLYLDVPWGGPDIYKNNNITLSIGNIPLHEFCLSCFEISKILLIVCKLPRNYNIDEFNTLLNINKDIIHILSFIIVLLYRK